MKKETLEETAKRLYEYQSQNPPYTIITPKAKIEGFIEGAKWQQEQMFDIMQQYAAFCVKCDREKLPLLFAKEWFEQFKNK